jgi:transcription initiation factor IIF auxiliary subunit
MQIQARKEHASRGKYKIVQSYKYTGDDHWDWSVWVESSDKELDKIAYVVYNLHFSFADPVRIVKTRENNFKLSTSGWGIFTIYARVNFKDATVLDLEHELELAYPDRMITDTNVLQNNKHKLKKPESIGFENQFSHNEDYDRVDKSIRSKMLYTMRNKAFPSSFLSKEIIRQRIELYLKNKHALLSNQMQANNPQKEETKWVWYSKEQIQTLLDEMTNYEGDGVRIYFGEKAVDDKDGYNENRNMSEEIGQLCLIMVLTKSGTHSDSHVNIIFEEMADFEYRLGLTTEENTHMSRARQLDFGSYCPPNKITEGVDYPE